MAGHADDDGFRGGRIQPHEESAFAGLAHEEGVGRKFQSAAAPRRVRGGGVGIHFPLGNAHGGIRGIG